MTAREDQPRRGTCKRELPDHRTPHLWMQYGWNHCVDWTPEDQPRKCRIAWCSLQAGHKGLCGPPVTEDQPRPTPSPIITGISNRPSWEAQGEAPQDAKCPSCGSRDRGVRNCMVENCGETHFEETSFSADHRKVVCSDSWHRGAHPSQDAPQDGCPKCGSFVNKCGHSKMRIYSKPCDDGSGRSQAICVLCERGARSTPSLPNQPKIECGKEVYRGLACDRSPGHEGDCSVTRTDGTWPVAPRESYGGSTPSPDQRGTENAAFASAHMVGGNIPADYAEKVAPSPDPPTIADAERFIRKMEACENMAAKLILLQHFIKRAALGDPGRKVNT